MKILLVSDLCPPAEGGLAAHVARLARELVRRGHAPTVVTVGDPEESGCSDGVPVQRVRLAIERVPGVYLESDRAIAPPWRDHALAGAIAASVVRDRPQLIHAHGWSAFSAAGVARQAGLPLVVTLHDYGLLCPLRTLLRGTRPCRSTVGFVCVSCPGTNQGLLKRSGLAAALRCSGRRTDANTTYVAVPHAVADRHRAAGVTAEMRVIPNFIDALPRDPGLVPHGGTMLYVGPSTAEKGAAIAVAAHQRLIRQGCDITLHHVGGSRVESDRATQVQRSGRLDGAALDDAFRRSSVVVVPSVCEDACPTVAIEAMASARPTVASAIGGLTDLIEDDRSGLLVAPGDVVALSDAVASLVADPSRAQRLGAGARERAACFTSAAVVPRIEALYREVVS